MHPEIFKGGVKFFKKKLVPNCSWFSYSQKGFAVLVAFCYNICVFKKPVITILKVVGCEKCVRKELLAAGQSLQIFLEKSSRFNAIWMTFCMFLDQ